MSIPDNLSPSANPFDAYLREHPETKGAAPVLHAVALAKRILLQERVRDFTAADVVALAAVIVSREK